MSRKERERLRVMERLQSGSLKLKDACKLMGVSYRQGRRILMRWRASGSSGLVHAGRGRASNRRLEASIKERALALYREHYGGFGPTLACEKMRERDSLEVDHETLRRWLMQAHLWQGRSLRQGHRKRRPRKEHFGEMVQLDGSDHEWIEGQRLCLIQMIDDATGRSLGLMCKEETLEGVLTLYGQWIRRHGVPRVFYTDRKSLYVVDRDPTQEERRQGSGPLTDFGRVCWRLGTRILAAHSPQAKGRVERRHGVHQDRLVKELRLRGVNNMDAVNAMLGGFFRDIDGRFACAPALAEDYHLPLPKGRPLADLLSVESERRVANDWTISYRGRTYQILSGQVRSGSAVKVFERLDARVFCEQDGERLKIRQIIGSRKGR